VLNGLYLLYTSQNLLGTIFRVTFTVFYRRIWNIVEKYSILCCDKEPLDYEPSPVRKKDKEKTPPHDDDVYSLSKLSPPGQGHQKV
jgi:hypothetical protein